MPSPASRTRIVVGSAGGGEATSRDAIKRVSYADSTSRASNSTFGGAMPDRAASNLAAVPGITVGHWTDPAGATGCTVVLAPAGGLRAAADAARRAHGTPELGPLGPRHLV